MSEESTNKKNRERTEGIIASLGNLPFYQNDIQSGIFEANVEALVVAIKEERWDLIAEAASYMALETLPLDDPKRLSEEAKQIAFYMSGEGHPDMTKADILEFINRVWPDHFETIPQSKRGLTNWWKEVGGIIDQARKYMTPSQKKEFEKHIENSIRLNAKSERKFMI